MMRLLQSVRIQRVIKIQRCSFIAIPKIAREEKQGSTDGMINHFNNDIFLIRINIEQLIARIAIRFNREELSPSKCLQSSRDNAPIIGNRRLIS